MENLNQLLDKYDKLPLECDGLVKVLHYVLKQHDISHRVVYGLLSSDRGSLPHYWIKLPMGKIIDYRARMWMGDKAPHGIFNPMDYEVVDYLQYEVLDYFKVSEFVVRVLGVHPKTLEIIKGE